MLTSTYPPPLFTGPPVSDSADAMDKLCGRYDVNVANTSTISDAFDKILLSSEESEDELLVETDTTIPYPDPDVALPGETTKFKLKPCCISVTRLETILLDDVSSDDTPKDASDLPVGEYYTRSRATPKKERTGRRPRKASTGIKYELSDDHEVPVPKADKPVPSRSGPSASRLRAQSSKTEEPMQRLPPVPSLTSPDEEEDDAVPLVVVQRKLRTVTPKQKPKGVFKTKEHGIKKKETKDRKYRCKLCDKSVLGARALTVHHQQKHGILYCDHCQKAFNNQRSLAKHLYTHKTLKFKCTKCGKAFPFKSQLTTH